MEKQIKLTFEPIAHKYSDETGLVYTSATTVVGKYKEPFNQKYWSMYTALKDSGIAVRPSKDLKTIVVDGIFRSLDSLYKNPINSYEVKALLNKWKVMTEDACARGNKVHDYLETTINLSKGDEEGETNEAIKPQLVNALAAKGLEVIIRTKHDLDLTDLEAVYPKIYKRLLDYINAGCTIFAEKKIYTTQFQVAGMIDVLIIKGKQFAILDWKTNKDEMMFQSGYFKKINVNGKWTKGGEYILMDKRLFAPLNTIQDCKGMIYTLQLSLYAFIMELWGYKLVPNGLEIFHLRPNLEPKLIRVRYLKQEVHQMLVHHKEHQIKQTRKTNNIFGVK